jgi:hypothetical protein
LRNGTSSRGCGAGPKIAAKAGMCRISVLLLVAAVGLDAGCGSQTLGSTGLGGHGTGGEGHGTGGDIAVTGSGGVGEGGSGGAETGSGGDGPGGGFGASGGGAATGGGGATDASTDAGPGGPNAPCRTAPDCRLGTTCVVPGSPAFCGVCFPPSQTCSTDSDCGDVSVTGAEPRPAICNPVNCGCDGAKTCQAGCLSDSDCAAGLGCGSDHRCAPTDCTSTSGSCPVDFTCGSDGHCARRSCTSDSQCSDACVLGACYGAPGYCAGDVV